MGGTHEARKLVHETSPTRPSLPHAAPPPPRWLLAKDEYSMEARLAISKLRGLTNDEDVQVGDGASASADVFFHDCFWRLSHWPTSSTTTS